MPPDDIKPTAPQPPPTPASQLKPPRRRRQKLPAFHVKLLELMCGGATLREAAAQAGVPLRSAQRWQARYASEIRKARSALLDGIVGRAHSDLPTALEALRQLAENQGASAAAGASVRRAAASALVDAFATLIKVGDVDARLSRIEELLAARLGAALRARPALTVLPTASSTEG